MREFRREGVGGVGLQSLLFDFLGFCRFSGNGLGTFSGLNQHLEQIRSWTISTTVCGCSWICR